MIGNKSTSIISDEISIVVTKKNPSSSEKLDGEVKIIVRGGKAPYKLVVSSSARTVEMVYTGEKFDLKNLPKGFYLLSVTDSNGNFTSQNINL